MKILIINGPNLNMLGIREPALYGRQDYHALGNFCKDACRELSAELSDEIECEIYQSNHEGEIVTRIQQAYFDHVDGIVINPGAYTHTSIALLDAVKAVMIPTVEVHISDVDSRDDFRKVSYIREACVATVSGRGFDGYIDAIKILMEHAG